MEMIKKKSNASDYAKFQDEDAHKEPSKEGHYDPTEHLLGPMEVA